MYLERYQTTTKDRQTCRKLSGLCGVIGAHDNTRPSVSVDQHHERAIGGSNMRGLGQKVTATAHHEHGRALAERLREGLACIVVGVWWRDHVQRGEGSVGETAAEARWHALQELRVMRRSDLQVHLRRVMRHVMGLCGCTMSAFPARTAYLSTGAWFLHCSSCCCEAKQHKRCKQCSGGGK